MVKWVIIEFHLSLEHHPKFPRDVLNSAISFITIKKTVNKKTGNSELYGGDFSRTSKKAKLLTNHTVA